MMPIEDDSKNIDDFLAFARTIDTFAGSEDIYELFGINKNDSYPEIEAKINEFKNQYSGIGAPKFKNLGRMVSNIAETIKRVLSEHKDEYDEYLEENRPKIKKLLEYFLLLTKRDKILDSKEKHELIEEGLETGLYESKIYSLIDKWKKKYHVEEAEHSSSVSTSSEVPFDVLLNKTYYEFLGLSEDVDYSQIKEVYDREYQKYNTVRDKKRAEARWVVVSEAWECLRDPVKRREYDEEQRKKRERGLTREGDPKLEIVDEIGNEKSSFEFKNMKLSTIRSVTVTAKNGGGGTLDAKIKTNRSWLIVDTDRIHQSKLPQRITITVDPRKDSSKNTLGGEDTGVIEISYQRGSYIESERVSVGFSIEMPAADLTRFRKNLTIGGLIFGALFGYFVYQGMNEIVAGIAVIVAVIGAVIAAAWLGYQDKEAGAAFASGCGTLIVVIIIGAILESYFPHALSTFSWALAYGSFGNLLSTPIRKALWQRNLVLPITIGALTLALTGGIVIAGFVSAKQEREAKFTRSKAIQRTIQTTVSKLPGEWHGKVGKSTAKLFIIQESGRLSGKMVYQRVEEKLSVDLKNNDGQIVIILKGTSYKRLKGKDRFNLDTFYGALSSGGDSIRGEYVDAGRKKGKWSVSKVASAPRTRCLFVETEPLDAVIRVLNIPLKFYQGMELEPGRYHLEVSAMDYQTKDLWVKINAGEDERLTVKLKRSVTKAQEGKPGESLIFSQNVPISADTTIWRDYNNNCGDHNGSSNKGIGVSTRAGINRLHRALLQFKVEEVPAGTRIAKATVRLYALEQGEYRDNYFHISRLTERWEPRSTTWCKRTVSKSWSTHGGVWARKGQAAVLIPSKHGSIWHQATGSYKEWIEWDVTQIVKDWVENGKPNFGIIVHQPDIDNRSENQGIDFCAKEYSDVSLRPQLVIRTNVVEKK